MHVRWSLLALALLLTTTTRGAAEPERQTCGAGGDEDDPTAIDASLLPDFWDAQHAKDVPGAVDPRIATNAADEPLDQLIKVTDRRHRHPVFASMCSIAFLVAIVIAIVACTQS